MSFVFYSKKKKLSWKKSLALFFNLKNDKNETFADEVNGGLTMFLVTIYMLNLAQIMQGVFLFSF